VRFKSSRLNPTGQSPKEAEIKAGIAWKMKIGMPGGIVLRAEKAGVREVGARAPHGQAKRLGGGKKATLVASLIIKARGGTRKAELGS